MGSSDCNRRQLVKPDYEPDGQDGCHSYGDPGREQRCPEGCR